VEPSLVGAKHTRQIIDGMPDPPSADSARARNRALFEGAFGEIYGLYIEQERLSRVIAALMWGADVRPFYASMRVIGEVRDGGVIVDVPCGAGVAFRGIRAGCSSGHADAPPNGGLGKSSSSKAMPSQSPSRPQAWICSVVLGVALPSPTPP
jgi:hypothetical protein